MKLSILMVLLFTSPAFAQTTSTPVEGYTNCVTGDCPSTSTAELGDANTQPTKWKINSSVSVPFRGFVLQTGKIGADVQDKIDRITYAPGASLEGTLALSYDGLGFSYTRTLTAADLDAEKKIPAGINEEFRFSILLNNSLYEVSHQNLVGLQSNVETTPGAISSVAREDMRYSDFRGRWIYGLPIGTDRPLTLSNYYQSADGLHEKELSVDLLLSTEVMHQDISGASPFIPEERRAAFGQASTLSEVSSTGLGVGAGFGLTALMYGKSYFSFGGLAGGSFNLSSAKYATGEESISGFGTFLNARMAVKFLFGKRLQQEFGVKLLADMWMIPADKNNIAASDASLAVNYGVAF